MELQITMNIKKRYFFLLFYNKCSSRYDTAPNPRLASLGGSIPRSVFISALIISKYSGQA